MIDVNASRVAAITIMLVWFGGLVTARQPAWMPAYVWPLVAWLGVVYVVSTRRHYRMIVPMIALVLFPLLYLLNPSHDWIEGVGLIPIDGYKAYMPATIHAGQTAPAVLVFVTAVALFVLSAHLSNRDLKRALMIGAVTGGLLGAWVIHERIVPRPFPVFEWTGVFAYRNFHAALMNMLIPLAFVAGIRSDYESRERGQGTGLSCIFYLLALIMMGSVFLTGSRMGLFVSACMMGGGLLLGERVNYNYAYLYPPRLNWSPLRRLSLFLALGLVVAFVAFQSGMIRPMNLDDWLFRGSLIQSALRIGSDQWLWGTGPGTFSVAFPYYRDDALQNVELLHAHNEPAQLFSEYGLAGALILFLLSGWLWVMCKPKESPATMKTPSVFELERGGLVLACVALGLHAMVDFPLRAPVNLWTLAMGLGFIRGIK